MNHFFKISAAALLLLAGCAQQETDFDVSGQEIFLTASTEPGTRTTLQDGGTQVFWEPGDKITVFFNGKASEFTAQNTQPATVTDFAGTIYGLVGANEGAASGNYIWGLFPYSDSASCDGQTVTTSFPKEQAARAGSFSSTSNLALARSSGLDLAFYNVCGGIRFTLTQEGIERIILKSANAEPLAGNSVKIAFEDGVPKVQSIGGPFGEIVLYAPASADGTASSFQTGVWYYINTLPCELQDGFSIEFHKGDMYAVRTTDKSVTIRRGSFGSISRIDEGLEFIQSDFEMVDLGLSVKWATMNVGAEKTEDYGEYFAWGDTRSKGVFNLSNYCWYDSGSSTMTRYNDSASLGTVDFMEQLLPEDDAAYMNWGDQWRMPTREETEELVNDCTWTWTLFNRTYGYKVTSNKPGYTDQWIFLPAGGYYEGDTLYEITNMSYFWTSSLYSHSFRAYSLAAGQDNGKDRMEVVDGPRSGGAPVRPVYVDPAAVSWLFIDKPSFTLEVGQSEKIQATVLPETAVNRNVVWRSTNPSVASVADDGTVTALEPGHAFIKVSTENGERTVQGEVTVTAGGREIVDLGLSVKWAGTNIGANNPEEYGRYFAWGETGLKGTFSWGTYSWCEGSAYNLTKYNESSAFGIADYRYTLEPEDDAACYLWGSNWRMPTKQEIEELVNGCSWVWTTVNGRSGYKVTSKQSGHQDKSIFIPASGYYVGNSIEAQGVICSLWTSSLQNGCTNAYGMLAGLDNGKDRVEVDGGSRDTGFTIRPVYASPTSVSWVRLDQTAVSLLTGESAKLTATVLPETASNKGVTWSSNDTSVATIDQNGNILAVGEGSTVVYVTTQQGTRKAGCKVDVTAPVREAVDLGLSVKWANFNVGSTTFGGDGDHFAWGETEPKNEYSWTTYKYRNTAGSLFKYNSSVDGRELLEPGDDAARTNWGEEWRIPTSAEWDELMKEENCSWEWTSYNGRSGYKVTSKISGYTDQWIFLPASNYKDNEEDYHLTGALGSYWTSSLSEAADDPSKASRCYFTANITYQGAAKMERNLYSRNAGLSVRAVYADPAAVSWVTLAPYSVSLSEGETATLTATVLPETATNKLVRWESDDPSIAVVTGDGIVRGVAPGNTMIHVTTVNGLKRAGCLVEVKESGVKPVDLGLSVKWASANLGASAPEHFGDYYAWAESQPKLEYNWTTYWWSNGNATKLTRYVTDNAYGTVDNREIIEPEQDAACAGWGGNWRMPTEQEMQELIDGCTWTRYTLNRVNGYKVTSNKSGFTDQWIFLPEAGYYYDTELRGRAEMGYYWTSTLGLYDKFGSALTFGGEIKTYDEQRSNGLCIRPVYAEPTSVSWVKLDRTSASLLVDETVTLSATVLPETATNKRVTWSSSKPEVASVDANGNVTAKKMGETVIYATTVDGSRKAGCTVTVTLQYLQAVDLGLSVKWASFNLGATNINELGDCYAWGETEPRRSFSWSNYQLANGSGSSLTAYKDGSKPVLDLSDDAAHAQWGGQWRMPTAGEMEELVTKCKWTLASGDDGVKYYKVSSQVSGYTSNYIFLPAAGYRTDFLTNDGFAGYYWTSSLNLGTPSSAYYLSFTTSNGNTGVTDFDRCYGLRIRPVMPK